MSKHKNKSGVSIIKEYADYINDVTFWEIHQNLSLLAMTSIEIENLPITMSERFLMESLFYNGQACFYNSLEFGLITAKCTGDGNLNIYGDNVTYTVYTDSGVFNVPNVHNDENFVYIRANYFRRPMIETVDYYAYKIWNIERTIDLNIDAQKMPYVFRTSENQYLTVKDKLEKMQRFQPAIFEDKEVDDSEVNVINLEAPLVAGDLFNLKQRYLDEFCTKIGINNANTGKRERLVTDEVNSNNELTVINGDSMLVELQKSCSEANIKFGTNMKAKLRNVNLRETFLDDELISSGTPFNESEVQANENTENNDS